MSEIDDARREVSRQLGNPTRLRFPEGWRTSRSWKRVQDDPIRVREQDAKSWIVQVGHGDPHRAEMFIHDGRVCVECDCNGFRYNEWCAHVAALWWCWVRERLSVPDLATGRNQLFPPAWIRVPDAEQEVRADGGKPARAPARPRDMPSQDPPGGCPTDCLEDPESQYDASIDRVLRDRRESYATRRDLP